MELKRVFFTIILIEVATQRFSVEGLQCYVCEDCNEYEDFKELHICGEIPVVVTGKPFTLPEILDSSTTRKPFKRTSPAPSPKPIVRTTTEDYLYEDSGDRHDAQSSSQKNVSSKASTQTSATSGLTITYTRRPTAMTAKLRETTTQPAVTNSAAGGGTETSNAESLSTTSSVAANTTRPILDYDDYVEYEDPLPTRRNEVKSVLKVSEPVCYMIRYHVNNTLLTNRGCTTFINANKYLTCQSLNNDAPMDSCRVCSSNGCNKFLDDDGYDDNYFNAAATLQHFVVIILLTCVPLIRAII